MPAFRPLLDRFSEKFLPDPETGCWNWTACLSRKGYSRLQIRKDGRSVNVEAHIISYELFIGDIPPGKEIHHECRNRKCVNPNHLKAITHAENADNNRIKTHCPLGHEYTKENIYYFKSPNGNPARICVACRRIYEAKKRGIPIEKYGLPKQFCAQGHEFTPENTIQTDRQRVCRACRAKHRASYNILRKERRRLANGGGPTTEPPPTNAA